MTLQDKTHSVTSQAKLEEAIRIAKLGHKAEAGELLRSIVALQPVNQAAWLWLSAVAMSQAEAETALAQARQIDPTHPGLLRAEQWFVHRFSPSPETKKSKIITDSSTFQPITQPKGSKNLWAAFNPVAFGLAILAVSIGLLVLFWGLILEVRAAVQPTYAVQSTKQEDAAVVIEEVEKELADGYIQKGLTLRDEGHIKEAVTNFEQALNLTPNHLQAQHELRLASAYLAGTEHYQAGRWQEAVTELEIVWAETDAYPNVRDLLYSSYYNLSLARQAAAELPQAKEAIQAAIALRPDLSTPQRILTEIEFAMAGETPPTTAVSASVKDKLIVVGLAEQRMVVYEGDWQVFDFIVSTGEPGRETAVGEFEIQNKIDVAYASTWNLDMPYWMGIYWAGPLQNGIHSLPIVKHTGQKLWDGYLGQRVSYGCIILGDDDAAKLYNWAEVGAKVKIVPSLAEWSPKS